MKLNITPTLCIWEASVSLSIYNNDYFAEIFAWIICNLRMHPICDVFK